MRLVLFARNWFLLLITRSLLCLQLSYEYFKWHAQNNFRPQTRTPSFAVSISRARVHANHMLINHICKSHVTFAANGTVNSSWRGYCSPSHFQQEMKDISYIVFLGTNLAAVPRRLMHFLRMRVERLNVIFVLCLLLNEKKKRREDCIRSTSLLSRCDG